MCVLNADPYTHNTHTLHQNCAHTRAPDRGPAVSKLVRAAARGLVRGQTNGRKETRTCGVGLDNIY